MGSGQPDRHSGKQGRSIMSAIARRGRILFWSPFAAASPSRICIAGRSCFGAGDNNASAVLLSLPENISGDFSVAAAWRIRHGSACAKLRCARQSRYNLPANAAADESPRNGTICSRAFLPTKRRLRPAARRSRVFSGRAPFSVARRPWRPARRTRALWMDQSRGQPGHQAGQRLGAIWLCRFLGFTAANAWQRSRRL